MHDLTHSISDFIRYYLLSCSHYPRHISPCYSFDSPSTHLSQSLCTYCAFFPEHPFHKYHHRWCLHCIQVFIQKTHDHRGIPDCAPQIAIPTLLLNSRTCFVFIPTVSHLTKYNFYDCAYLLSVFHYKNKHVNRTSFYSSVFLAPRTVPSTQ